MIKKFVTPLLVIIVTIAAISLSSCKKKMSDADIKANVEAALRKDPMSAGTMVEVNNGVATITGQCKDDMCKATCEKTVAGVKGVKSVVNNCMVAAPMPPPVITADDPLMKAVQDAIKDNPGVSATINDGVVTLTGTIKKADLPKLMQKINATRPKKVENKLTVN